MKRISLSIVFVFCFLFGVAQINKSENLLEVDSLWAKEVFEFPIHFAPEVNYKGFEEAYFPKEWSNQDSIEYWSYAFAWSIEGNIEVKESTLEHDLQLYFDGLMTVVNKGQNFKVPESIALFLKDGENSFKGKIRLYNAFHTKDMMTLNVSANSYKCLEKDKTLLLFRFSPSDFDTDIWETLEAIKFKANACEIDISED